MRRDPSRTRTVYLPATTRAEKLPSRFVSVNTRVGPSMSTATPGFGTLFEPSTTPLNITLWGCAIARPAHAIAASNSALLGIQSPSRPGRAGPTTSPSSKKTIRRTAMRTNCSALEWPRLSNPSLPPFSARCRVGHGAYGVKSTDDSGRSQRRLESARTTGDGPSAESTARFRRASPGIWKTGNLEIWRPGRGRHRAVARQVARFPGIQNAAPPPAGARQAVGPLRVPAPGSVSTAARFGFGSARGTRKPLTSVEFARVMLRYRPLRFGIGSVGAVRSRRPQQSR